MSIQRLLDKINIVEENAVRHATKYASPHFSAKQTPQTERHRYSSAAKITDAIADVVHSQAFSPSPEHMRVSKELLIEATTPLPEIFSRPSTAEPKRRAAPVVNENRPSTAPSRPVERLSFSERRQLPLVSSICPCPSSPSLCSIPRWHPRSPNTAFIPRSSSLSASRMTSSRPKRAPLSPEHSVADSLDLLPPPEVPIPVRTRRDIVLSVRGLSRRPKPRSRFVRLPSASPDPYEPIL